MVLKVFTLTLKEEDAFLSLVSSKPFTHLSFQLQTKAVIRYHMVMVMDKLFFF